MDTLKYITSIATAVTLTITPVIVSKPTRENEQANKVIWPEQGMALRSNIQIDDVISLAGPPLGYFLSSSEQGALKRALLRSVKIIEPRLA